MSSLRRYSIPVLFLLLSALLYVSLLPRSSQDGNKKQGLRKLAVTRDFQDPRSIQAKMLSKTSMMQQQQQQHSQQVQQSLNGLVASLPVETDKNSDVREIQNSQEQPRDASEPLLDSPQGEQEQQVQQHSNFEQQQEEQSEEEKRPTQKKSNLQLEQLRLKNLLTSRNKHILTLGGSTTWGSKLENRESAYPYLLPKLLGPTWKVSNLAVRATDASYASQCIESMVREGATENKDPEFDVIVLEYSLNGLDGMPLLLQRLRQRYPKAVIMYVHLWSLRMSVDNAQTGVKPRDELNKGLKFKQADENINAMLADPSARWAWAPKMKSDSEAIRNAAKRDMAAIGGHLYEVLPMPEESPQVAFDEHWFGPDFHHLSNHGHTMVAKQLAELLQDDNIMNTNTEKQDIHDITLTSTEQELGSWGAGDHCYSWYETGTHPDVQFDGGTVKNFVKNDKWAVNVGLTFGQPANIRFPNKKPVAQPVMLMIMSWGPGVYPKAQIDLQSPGFANQTSILDPLHPNPLNHLFHVTRTAHVGWANAMGESLIVVDPIEDMQRPLRVIGIVMCGACLEMDPKYLHTDSTHQRLGGTMPFPEEIPSTKANGKNIKQTLTVDDPSVTNENEQQMQQLQQQHTEPQVSVEYSQATTAALSMQSNQEYQPQSQQGVATSNAQGQRTYDNQMQPQHIPYAASNEQHTEPRVAAEYSRTTMAVQQEQPIQAYQAQSQQGVVSGITQGGNGQHAYYGNQMHENQLQMQQLQQLQQQQTEPQVPSKYSQATTAAQQEQPSQEYQAQYHQDVISGIAQGENGQHAYYGNQMHKNQLQTQQLQQQQTVPHVPSKYSQATTAAQREQPIQEYQAQAQQGTMSGSAQGQKDLRAYYGNQMQPQRIPYASNEEQYQPQPGNLRAADRRQQVQPSQRDQENPAFNAYPGSQMHQQPPHQTQLIIQPAANAGMPLLHGAQHASASLGPQQPEPDAQIMRHMLQRRPE